MNQDTIPSQLGPMTIPSALGPTQSSSSEPEAAGFGSAIKWVLLAAVLGGVWFISR